VYVRRCTSIRAALHEALVNWRMTGKPEVNFPIADDTASDSGSDSSDAATFD
jgi:hypothetical protein